MKKIQLQKVYYIPRELEEGILYYSEEFSTASHLCPCGCRNKVVTPIGPINWSFTEKYGEATLDPSLGNWQLPCRSHYWIINGMIEWSYPWTEEQIERGRKHEEIRSNLFHEKLDRKPMNRMRKFIFSLFKPRRNKSK